MNDYNLTVRYESASGVSVAKPDDMTDIESPIITLLWHGGDENGAQRILHVPRSRIITVENERL